MLRLCAELTATSARVRRSPPCVGPSKPAAEHADEHYLHPCTLNERARYNVSHRSAPHLRLQMPNHPAEGYSVEMRAESIAEFSWPHGTYWASQTS